MTYDQRRFKLIQAEIKKNPDISHRQVARNLGLTYGQVTGCIYRQRLSTLKQGTSNCSLSYAQPSAPRRFSFETSERPKVQGLNWGAISLAPEARLTGTA